ncbi:hypothetical protein [Ammoniphilus sp. 3BR4]|uniref:hypothetical protein n=1 Tax=Ammoniphilus sp. 3BR4 TaxID=3158265 RepID=UPI0034669EE5
MLKGLKERRTVKQRIAEERRKFLKGVHLARSQWQFGQLHQDQQGREYELLDILERRYMFLYEMAKKRKLHALE